MQILFYLQALSRLVEVYDREALHAQIWQYSSHITAGVTYALHSDPLGVGVSSFSDGKAVWVITHYDGVECKVTSK
jgi:hypothetical protein